MPVLAGLAFLGFYYIAGMVLPAIVDRGLLKRFGLIRYLITYFLLLTMLLVPIKILMRLAFGIKYILITPHFCI
jgi:hypothetical protein